MIIKIAIVIFIVSTLDPKLEFQSINDNMVKTMHQCRDLCLPIFEAQVALDPKP